MVDFLDAAPYVGLDNIEMRDRVAQDFGGVWTRDMRDGQRDARRRERRADERDHGRAEGMLRAGWSGSQDGLAQRLKAILVQGQTHDFETAQPYKGYNRAIAQQLLDTSVVKHALRGMGTPFLYKPSRSAGRDGHEEQPGNDLDRSAGRRAHRPLSTRYGRVLPLSR